MSPTEIAGGSKITEITLKVYLVMKRMRTRVDHPQLRITKSVYHDIKNQTVTIGQLRDDLNFQITVHRIQQLFSILSSRKLRKKSVPPQFLRGE